MIAKSGKTSIEDNIYHPFVFMPFNEIGIVRVQYGFLIHLNTYCVTHIQFSRPDNVFRPNLNELSAQ